MAKLFMIQSYLNNLVTEGQAEVIGGDWRILLDDGARLYVICGDEGFDVEILSPEEDAWDKHKIECLSELKNLITR